MERGTGQTVVAVAAWVTLIIVVGMLCYGCSYTPYGSITNNTYNYAPPPTVAGTDGNLAGNLRADPTQTVTPSSRQASSAASANGSTTTVQKVGGDVQAPIGINVTIPAPTGMTTP